MEFRLILDDNEETLGDFESSEIKQLIEMLKLSLIFDVEGESWEIVAPMQLYFNIYPPYFYVSLIKLS